MDVYTSTSVFFSILYNSLHLIEKKYTIEYGTKPTLARQKIVENEVYRLESHAVSWFQYSNQCSLFFLKVDRVLQASFRFRCVHETLIRDDWIRYMWLMVRIQSSVVNSDRISSTAFTFCWVSWADRIAWGDINSVCVRNSLLNLDEWKDFRREKFEWHVINDFSR